MRRAAVWAGGIVAALLVSWVVMHFVISPVNPEQEPPDKHVDAPCWACHIVSGSAEIKSVEESAAP